MHEAVTEYLNGLTRWKTEMTRLRTIVLGCGLYEDYKWMHPCYTALGKNIVLLHEFKGYCAVLFPKGALLKDPLDILVQQTKNTQAARQMRFNDLQGIEALETTLKAYIMEAIEIEKSGRKVVMKKTVDYELPEELVHRFREDPEFEMAFKALTPGRQKGYLLHFAQPEQSKTRSSRIVRNRERIIDGYGLTDCTCGLSKRKPNCDGSHKQLQNPDSNRR